MTKRRQKNFGNAHLHSCVLFALVAWVALAMCGCSNSSPSASSGGKYSAPPPWAQQAMKINSDPSLTFAERKAKIKKLEEDNHWSPPN